MVDLMCQASFKQGPMPVGLPAFKLVYQFLFYPKTQTDLLPRELFEAEKEQVELFAARFFLEPASGSPNSLRAAFGIFLPLLRAQLFRNLRP
jgi:hypothetical protein